MTPLRAALATFFAAASIVPCCAQTTWKGLQFGQPRAAARAQLESQSIAAENTLEGALQSTSDYDLYLPGFTRALPLKVDLRFVDDHLTDVNLSLDVAAMRHNFPELGDEASLLTFAATRLTGVLTAKYGTPIARDASCDTVAASLVKHTAPACVTLWRGEHQAIGLNWFDHTGRLSIRYEMLTTDL